MQKMSVSAAKETRQAGCRLRHLTCCRHYFAALLKSCRIYVTRLFVHWRTNNAKSTRRGGIQDRLSLGKNAFLVRLFIMCGLTGVRSQPQVAMECPLLGMLVGRMQVPRNVNERNSRFPLKIELSLQQLGAVIVQQKIVPVILNQFWYKDSHVVIGVFSLHF
jgi:hypothetical protein